MSLFKVIHSVWIRSSDIERMHAAGLAIMAYYYPLIFEMSEARLLWPPLVPRQLSAE